MNLDRINPLKIDERRKSILELLEQKESLSVTELGDIMGVSLVTIRNDLNQLSRLGLASRTHGGVRKIEFGAAFQFKPIEVRNQDLKESIASCASSLIRDGDTIFINSGSTTYCVASQLRQKKNLSIVTNSIAIAMILADIPTFRIKLLGGNINSQFMFLFGHDSLEQLSTYRANKTILSVSGFSCLDYGVTTYHPEEASLDRLMMERSRETIIVADSTKYDFEGFYKVTELSRISKLITNKNLCHDAVAKIKKIGVEIILC